MPSIIDNAITGVDSDTNLIEGVGILQDSQLVARGLTDPRAAPVGYWRIPDDRYPRGRITLLPYGQNSTERLEREHYPLRRYGAYKSNGGAGAWAPWQDPFLGIIQRGGIAEFDAEQIIDLGWHRKPSRNARTSHVKLWESVQGHIDAGMDQTDAVLMVMPQLRGHDLTDYPCSLCPGRVFSSSGLLQKHEAMAHPANVRSREIRDAIVDAQHSGGIGQREIADAILALVKEMTAQRAPSVADSPRRGRPPKSAIDDIVDAAGGHVGDSGDDAQ